MRDVDRASAKALDTLQSVTQAMALKPKNRPDRP